MKMRNLIQYRNGNRNLRSQELSPPGVKVLESESSSIHRNKRWKRR